MPVPIQPMRVVEGLTMSPDVDIVQRRKERKGRDRVGVSL